jgi:PiT family inorganic phosphate transporter
MMRRMLLDPLTLAIVALALLFTFINGYNDSASLVASMIASGAMSPRNALLLAATAEFLGPLLFGVAVATTIGRGVVNAEAVSGQILLAALLAAIVWGIAAGRLRLPTSATHALVGGLVGAGVVSAGPAAVNWWGVGAVSLTLAAAPAIALTVGFVYMRVMLRVGRYLTPRVNQILRWSQVVTSTALAASHGVNDAQKGMGVIAAALVASGALPTFEVPTWAVVACAASIALGVANGGTASIRRLGTAIFAIRPVHAFVAQAASAAIVFGASILGGPASTTQVATSAIFGVGAAERWTKVRWQIGQAILLAWLVTIPLTALLAGGLVALLDLARRVAGLT